MNGLMEWAQTTEQSASGMLMQGTVLSQQEVHHWCSGMSKYLNRVVAQSHLPEVLTANEAMVHFQALLQPLSKTVRNHMSAAAAICRRQGLLVKMCVKFSLCVCGHRALHRCSCVKLFKPSKWRYR
jgi:hypothetical protein